MKKFEKEMVYAVQQFADELVQHDEFPSNLTMTVTISGRTTEPGKLYRVSLTDGSYSSARQADGNNLDDVFAEFKRRFTFAKRQEAIMIEPPRPPKTIENHDDDISF